MTTRLTLASIGLAVALASSAYAAGGEWLSLCAKCISPSIVSKSGIGTANAHAEARISQGDAADYCAQWQPGDRNCVREQMASPEARQTYRASANCQAGRITAIDGSTYTLAGVWTNDIGRGRSRWRDASGHIVGQDNASNGLAIAQQWEVLCPGATRAATAAPAAPPPVRTPAPGAVAGGGFAVGQVIEGKYGSDWIRGRINDIRVMNGRNGPVAAYDITLSNGKRGLVPARLIRPVGP